MSKPTLASMIEFHRARLVAIDNWGAAEAALAARGDRIDAIARQLGVTDLGAQSILAMAGGPLPSRVRIESELGSLEYLQRMIDGEEYRA